MPSNFYMWFVAALIPMFVGAIYYSDALFGKSWKSVNGFTDEFIAKGNMPMILGVSYLFSVFLAVTMTGVTIHQSSAFQMMMPGVMESGSEAQKTFTALMTTYGESYRTFGHGAVHGALAAIFFVLPIIGINSLFERRGWKYIFIHLGYWVITLALMGGLLCATIQYAPLS